jgi:hypothetical protein
LLAKYKKKGKEVRGHLEQMIADKKHDPVAQQFLALAGDPAVIQLELTDTAINLAHRRKLLGNPPCSRDKYTIGDEVNWELLLANLQEDLIVVTKDRAFDENSSLLSEEYQRRTGSKLLITETLSQALKIIGRTPSKKLIEAEKQLPAGRREDSLLGKKIDELLFLARWLYIAAHETGQVEQARGLIRHAMKATVEMYGLPKDDEPYDLDFVPGIISRFASLWDEEERELGESR